MASCRCTVSSFSAPVPNPSSFAIDLVCRTNTRLVNIYAMLNIACGRTYVQIHLSTYAQVHLSIWHRPCDKEMHSYRKMNFFLNLLFFHNSTKILRGWARYACRCRCVRIRVCVCGCVCLPVYLSACLPVYMCICECVWCVCVCVCVCVCLFACVCVREREKKRQREREGERERERGAGER